MTETAWHLALDAKTDDATLIEAVIESHQDIYRTHFEGDLAVNHALPIEVRSLRSVEGWRAFLLLTPWMLSRLWFADKTPDLDVPASWRASHRHGQDWALMGPVLSFAVLRATQKAHIAYHQKLGHYLIQPLIMAMEGFSMADDAFAAWDDVIRVRDENMEKAKRDCPMQKEVSRHELLGRLFRRS